MARIQLTTAQEKEIIQAIVDAGEVEVYGSRKLFSLSIRNSNVGKHLHNKQGLEINTKWNQLVDTDLKNKYRKKNNL